VALRAIVLALVVWGRSADADGVITRQGIAIATAPETDEPRAEPTDLARALSGLAFGVARMEVGGGEAAGQLARGFSGGGTLEAISAVYPFGSFAAGRFSAWYLANQHTARLRATLVDVDALFACRAPDGELHAPILGHSRFACVRGGRLGIGGALGDVQWDPESGRVMTRWGELLAIVDLSGRSSSMSYLSGHVDLALGVAGESVWHGRDEMTTGSDHFARGIAGVKSLIRSPSARWDASLNLVAEPALAGTVRALHDVGIVGEACVRYNALVGATSAISIGAVVHTGYWSDPSTSDTALDSVAKTTSLFAGIVVEHRNESPR
jgi:hypothetical protein